MRCCHAVRGGRQETLDRDCRYELRNFLKSYPCVNRSYVRKRNAFNNLLNAGCFLGGNSNEIIFDLIAIAGWSSDCSTFASNYSLQRFAMMRTKVTCPVRCDCSSHGSGAKAENDRTKVQARVVLGSHVRITANIQRKAPTQTSYFGRGQTVVSVATW
jgi:hypothetical protein